MDALNREKEMASAFNEFGFLESTSELGGSYEGLVLCKLSFFECINTVQTYAPINKLISIKSIKIVRKATARIKSSKTEAAFSSLLFFFDSYIRKRTKAGALGLLPVLRGKAVF